MSLITLILGIIVLVKSADIFVVKSSNLAKCLGINSLIIGLTVVAMGTSAPEASVSIIAAIKNNSSISIGNIVGSNICNMLLVLGLSSIFSSIIVKKEILKKDYLLSIMTYIILLLIALFNNYLLLKHGILLLIFFGLYIYIILKNVKNSKEEKTKLRVGNIIMLVLSLIGIILGGNLIVNSAIIIARKLSVSEHIIALTIVAIGTSLPELVTSVVAAIKHENDIALGNVIGSNIFNILFILGISGTINNLELTYNSLMDIIIMTIVGILIYIYMFIKRRLDKRIGIIFLLIYIGYIYYIIIR
ncbi:MAG TPA: calcium/sodium antiporter [Bacilli bacterium]|nr:calcium/sodium antiporter [Bacilli bacterium]